MRKSRKRRKQLFHQKEEHSQKDPAKYFGSLDVRVVLAFALIIGLGLALWYGWTDVLDMDRDGP